jgi:hypothetical protein
LKVSPRWFWLALVFLITQGVYLITLNPAFPNDDSAETITAGATLGLQHPPGYAFSAILDRCEYLIPLGSFGLRANWGSSLLASSTAVLLTFILYSLFETSWFLKKKDIPIWIINFSAVMGGLGLAFAPTYWQNALSAKGGVYLLSLCLQMLIMVCVVHSARMKKDKPNRYLGLSFFFIGLGLASHWETLVIFIPGVILFFVRTQKITKVRWVRLVLSLVLGISPLLYLPLRAHLNPVLDLGAADSWPNFWADLTRSYFSDHELTWVGVFKGLLQGSFTFPVLGGLLHQPFENKMEAFHLYLGWEIGWVGFILALGGMVLWFRSAEKKILFFLLPSGFLLAASMFSYFNISRTTDSPFTTLKFLLSGDWMFFLLASFTLSFLLSKINYWKRIASVLVMMLIVIFLICKTMTSAILDGQQNQLIAYDYGQNLLKSMPKGTLFFAESDEDYFSLYYLQQVGHLRPDVVMIPSFTLFEFWGTKKVEETNSDLGLTASSVSFPDHFARIIYATSELVVKNRNRRPIAFSNFNGAFHIYYMNRQKNIKVRSSGIVWLLDNPATRPVSFLTKNELRLRDDLGNIYDRSLEGIWKVYASVGLQMPAENE